MISPRHNLFLGGCRFRSAVVLVLGLRLSVFGVQAEPAAFSNFLAQGEAAQQRGDVLGALKFYSAADHLMPTNCADLCGLTKHYCDLMHDASSPDMQKTLAEYALAAARRAVQADPQSATAHLCVAVSYAKNFPFVDNRTKVNWSRQLKAECETAIALDPRQDVGHYLLGRWHFGVANMNFFLKGLVMVVYGGLPKASNAEAIKHFKQAITLNPNRIIHHFELASVYTATGETKLARVELEKCQILKPFDRDDEAAQRDAKTSLANLGL